jgi:hypothetical protein
VLQVLLTGWSSTLSTTQHEVLLQAAPAPAAPDPVPVGPPTSLPSATFELQAQVSAASLASSFLALMVAALGAMALWANGTTNSWEWGYMRLAVSILISLMGALASWVTTRVPCLSGPRLQGCMQEGFTAPGTPPP